MAINNKIDTSNFTVDPAAKLELPAMVVTFPNPHTAIIRVRPGQTVDKETVKLSHQAIYDFIGRDYGLIVDRQADYSVSPVPVFEFLNSWPPLKVIAIVIYRSRSETVAQIDKCFSQKPLAVFDHLDAAQTWVDQQMSRT